MIKNNRILIIFILISILSIISACSVQTRLNENNFRDNVTENHGNDNIINLSGENKHKDSINFYVCNETGYDLFIYFEDKTEVYYLGKVKSKYRTYNPFSIPCHNNVGGEQKTFKAGLKQGIGNTIYEWVTVVYKSECKSVTWYIG